MSLIKIADFNYALRRNLIDQISGHAGTAEVSLTFGVDGVYRDLGDDVPASEVQALIDFYYATGGPNWTNNTNWLADATVGNWYGVTVSGGHVTEVDLNNNNLDNVLTETDSLAFLSGLPYITELRVHENSGFGLTFSIADNSTLTYLQVGNTSSTITGSIADNSTLASLYVYATSSSTITGSIADNSTLTGLQVGNTSSTITGSIADNSTLTGLYVSNTSSTITGSIANNSTLVNLQVGNTSSTITGSIADNSTLTGLYVNHTSSTITGSIADNSTLTNLYVYGTSSTITGGTGTLASYNYKGIYLQDNAYTTIEVDEVVENIYRLRDNFDYTTPVLDISGTNDAPSGTYQYAATPSTGLEYIYALGNDDDSEGFNIWTITYTAP